MTNIKIVSLAIENLACSISIKSTISYQSQRDVNLVKNQLFSSVTLASSSRISASASDTFKSWGLETNFDERIILRWFYESSVSLLRKLGIKHISGRKLNSVSNRKFVQISSLIFGNISGLLKKSVSGFFRKSGPLDIRHPAPNLWPDTHASQYSRRKHS